MASILIIDDEKMLRRAHASTLERAGHTTLEAATGREAIQIIRHNPPDVVLTDIFMPDQDGLEVIMVVRKELPALKIIAMSGAYPEAPLYLDIARKLRVEETLRKPFTPEQMMTALDNALKGNKGRMLAESMQPEILQNHGPFQDLCLEPPLRGPVAVD